jgi:hypothetical protein
VAAGSVSPAPPAAEERPADVPIIWYHGGQSYSRGGRLPVCVSAEQHNFLKAFLDNDPALGTKELGKAVSNVTVVAQKLAKKFGEDSIRLPQDKGDGYFVRVRSCKSD